MVLLIQYTLIFSAVLILVALGGMFSERSGIINLGLEGIMVFGAMAGGMVMVLLPDTVSKATIVILTLIAAACAGMISSLLIGIAYILKQIRLLSEQQLICLQQLLQLL